MLRGRGVGIGGGGRQEGGKNRFRSIPANRTILDSDGCERVGV